MTGEEQRLGLEIYRQLAQGEPVLRSELARALEAPTDTVDELLGHPNLKCLTYTDKQGRIIGFGGLAVREMPHRFRIDGRTLYTWCAWDSLFLPSILDLEAEVDSPAPGGTVRVHLKVAPDGVKEVPTSERRDVVSSSERTHLSSRRSQGDGKLLPLHLFFPKENAAAWSRSHPDTTVISVSDAFELGRLMVHTRWRS